MTSNNLNELIKSSQEYDVIIEVGQAPNIQAFKAHSIILNSRCKYFKSKLNAINYNDKNVKIIKQPNVSIEVFDIIIKYIYDETISLENVNTSTVFDLLIASNELGLKELIKHIQLFLLENNTSWLRLNFSHVYQTSLKNDNLKYLQKFCANIIAKHPKIIFDSDEFLTLPENLLIFILKLDNLQIDEGKIWDYIIKWGIAQNPSLPPNLDQWTDEHFLALKGSLQKCLPLIRYFRISGNDVVKKIQPYQKILEPTLWADITLKFMSPKRTITTSRVLPPRTNSPTAIESKNQLFGLRNSGETHRVKGVKGKYEDVLVNLTKSLEIKPNRAVEYCDQVDICMSAPKSFTLSKSLPQGGHLQYHPDVNIQSVNQPLIDPEESADNAQKQAILCEYRRRRREAHNSVEHRRRDSINETIQEISTLIPDIYNDSSKLNKDVILDKAIEYIKHLQQMEGEHRAFNMMLENSVKDMKPGIPIKK